VLTVMVYDGKGFFFPLKCFHGTILERNKPVCFLYKFF